MARISRSARMRRTAALDLGRRASCRWPAGRRGAAAASAAAASARVLVARRQRGPPDQVQPGAGRAGEVRSPPGGDAPRAAGQQHRPAPSPRSGRHPARRRGPRPSGARLPIVGRATRPRRGRPSSASSARSRVAASEASEGSGGDVELERAGRSPRGLPAEAPSPGRRAAGRAAAVRARMRTASAERRLRASGGERPSDVGPGHAGRGGRTRRRPAGAARRPRRADGCARPRRRAAPVAPAAASRLDEPRPRPVGTAGDLSGRTGHVEAGESATSASCHRSGRRGPRPRGAASHRGHRMARAAGSAARVSVDVAAGSGSGGPGVAPSTGGQPVDPGRRCRAGLDQLLDADSSMRRRSAAGRGSASSPAISVRLIESMLRSASRSRSGSIISTG